MNGQTLTTTNRKPLFPLGRLLITPGAQDLLEGHPATIQALLTRHVTGDWSEMSKADQAENRFSTERPLRIFSARRPGARTGQRRARGPAVHPG